MGRPTTRRRSEAEIAALAARLAQDWTPGDLVLTWLRRHVAELTNLVRDGGWSWSDVARALDTAGIAYRSGRPWTARLLITKAGQARKAAFRTASHPDPTEAMARALREALGGLANVQQVVVNMPGAVPPPTPGPDIGSPVRTASLSKMPLGSALAGPDLPAAADDDAAEATDPEFAPAKPIGLAPSVPPAPAGHTPAPTPDVDVQDVLKRFLNKPKR